EAGATRLRQNPAEPGEGAGADKGRREELRQLDRAWELMPLRARFLIGFASTRVQARMPADPVAASPGSWWDAPRALPNCSAGQPGARRRARRQPPSCPGHVLGIAG